MDTHTAKIDTSDSYEVKWALGSITTNNDRRGDEIPAELFKNPKE